MNLIIVAALSEPPTETLPFRDVTYFSKKELKLDILIEVEKEMKDLYYHFMARKGMMDFISQMITIAEHEDGVRIDTELNFPRTIQTKAIRLENRIALLGQVRFLSGI